MGCSSPRRPPPKDDTDIFDDLWNSITDTASEFTRSLVGLPMFYRHTDEPPTLMARAHVLSVFAEPGILHPKIITFHLDKDVTGIVGPFRFVSRPVSVFDIVAQGWRNDQASHGPGMMFLFGTPLENATWLVAPGLRFTANSLFRPWNNHDEWIRQSFEDFRNISGEFEQHATEMQEHWRHANDRLTEAREQRDRGKELMDQVRTTTYTDKPRNIYPTVYTTASSTTTHMTQNADGSVHKETITTERLADGSTKTTRIVDTTPADGNLRSETTITTTPPPPVPGDPYLPPPLPEAEDRPWNRRHRGSANAPSEKLEKDVESDKKENNNSKHSAWWFWSRK